jgi:hypothetical protein
MKHFAPPGSSEIYYYNKWKSNSMSGILALALGLVSAFWSAIFAIYYANAWASITCAGVAVFFFFIMAIRFSDASNYYDRYLRSTINPTDNTTKQ